jgi:hypothetical protein
MDIPWSLVAQFLDCTMFLAQTKSAKVAGIGKNDENI